jgi:hypothetical protein
MTEPVDVTAVTRDALLLDALGRGDQPPPGDDVATMLAAWRADLAEPVAAPPLPAATPPAVPAAPPATRPAVPRRERRREVRVRAAIAIAASVLGLAGGAVIAASDAGPGSPLWPITKLVYDAHANAKVAERDAQRAISAARDAITYGRYADAERHLNDATVLIGRITDGGVADRLRGEVEALRQLLPAALPGADPAPSAPAGGAPSPGGPPGAGPGQTGGPGSGQTPDGGGVLPGLPLPTLPALPSLPPLLG